MALPPHLGLHIWHRWNVHTEETLKNPFWCHSNPLLVTKVLMSSIAPRWREGKREMFMWNNRYLHIDEILVVLVVFGEIGLN